MTGALDALQEQTFATVTSATAAAYPQDMRLAGARLTGYLDGHAFGVIGTSRPDGRPHAAVATYIRQDGTFWLPTMAKLGAGAEPARRAVADADRQRGRPGR